MHKTCRALTASKGGLTLALLLILVGCGSGVDSQTTSGAPTVAEVGILADVAVPDDYRSILPGKNGLELSTTMSVADLTSFFEDEMPGKGWSLSAPVVPKIDSAVMYFEQGDRQATVHIRRPPGRDETLVQVILAS